MFVGCLEELPSLETLISLEQSLVEGCVNLKHIRVWRSGQSLSSGGRSVSGCSELEELPKYRIIDIFEGILTCLHPQVSTFSTLENHRLQEAPKVRNNQTNLNFSDLETEKCIWVNLPLDIRSTENIPTCSTSPFSRGKYASLYNYLHQNINLISSCLYM